MYLVSACLAGFNCRYDGKNCYNKLIFDMVSREMAIPVCPEIMGGLLTPRVPLEVISKKNKERVFNKDGKDFTKEFNKGAKMCLKIAKENNIKIAILKSKSPSCGFEKIYDGTFSGKFVERNGITSDLLSKNGIEILNENNFKNNL